MAIDLKTTQKNDLIQLVTFSIENEEYGMNIADVIEIIRLPSVQKLPKSPEFLKGIINLRGEVVPIVDIRERFSLKQLEDNTFKRTIIVKIDDRKIGMIVDSVSKVIRVPVSEIKDPPNFSSLIQGEYITGVILMEKRMIIMLNVSLIFSDDEISHLGQVSEMHNKNQTA